MFLSKTYGKTNLEHMIDQKWQHQNILLILCGSSVSFMVKDVMGYESPLYGRRTVNMELKPLNYHEASQFFPDFTDEDKIKAYCILGGIPYYLNLFDDKLSIKENISNTIFKDISVLRDEPMFLLKQEFRELNIYNSIIEAIATGSSKFNEISQKIHEPSSKCSIYLKNLKEVGIVDKVLPYGEKEDSKKSIYEISDFYFRFWYRFVFANSSVLALLGEKDYTNLIYEDIPSVLGNAFEKVCLQYMILLAKSGRLPFVPKGLSRWWGNDPISKNRMILIYFG